MTNDILHGIEIWFYSMDESQEKQKRKRKLRRKSLTKFMRIK